MDFKRHLQIDFTCEDRILRVLSTEDVSKIVLKDLDSNATIIFDKEVLKQVITEMEEFHVLREKPIRSGA